MASLLERFDRTVIGFLRKTSGPFARIALFIIFFWFGLLKVIGTSSANPMVKDLLHATMPFMSWETFIVLFSFYEMLIGIIFLFPGLERVAIALFVPHMIMTFLPLVFLPAMTWQSFLTPTLEGQYIIKNLVLIALAMGIAANLTPMRLGNRAQNKGY